MRLEGLSEGVPLETGPLKDSSREAVFREIKGGMGIKG